MPLQPERRVRKFTEEYGGGFIGSVLLHLCAGLLALFFWVRTAPHLEPPRLVPVDIVRQGPQGSPGGTAGATQVSPRRISRAGAAVAPEAVRPPPDEIEMKLEALAKLKQDEADPGLAVPGDGVSGNGGSGAYSVRDYVRAQVERHWNPDVSQLGRRNQTILIHIVMTNDGTIASADIVSQGADDPIGRSLAISARNAVLLSSPIALPAGHYEKVMNITLDLNPKDTLH